MKFYVSDITDKGLTVRVRAEGNGLLGDMIETVVPGTSIFGYSFEELKKRGAGSFTAKEKNNKTESK